MISRPIVITTLAAGLVVSSTASGSAIEDELAAIKARLAALERQVAEQNHVIQEKDRQIQELVANPSVRERTEADHWTDRVEIGGVIEVEAGYHDPYTGDSETDLVVATVEFGIAAQINDWVAGEITLLYEEDDTPLEVDVATITVAPPEGNWFATAGQMYVPFGIYETNLVSDPLTLEIGETRETAAMFGIGSDGFGGAVYFFNGDSDKGTDNGIDRFGATAGYDHEGDNGGFAVHVGYISHIGDSDAIQDAIGGPVVDYVGGVAVDASFSSGPFGVIAEYVAATDSFQMTELLFGTGGAEPTAYNIEAAYGFELGGKAATVAIGYQGTEEALALDLPKRRIAVALSVEVMDSTTLSFEWAHDDDYDVADGGTGESANTATAQLAVEF